ncbi:DUF262 domain-containing protein [Aeromicrobium fastidiosum]|uniref:GmrSD restriction endonuclease domain-containing protein n=1 Tax=Aeromicrobium fastidiosum TaxID=52699 RepID=UPI0020234FDE|nr:DUF262 domain-containing protein [Aeromicrobium fastidiosum]MCL8251353.1 DUF262 domain-containing protein [Aeromicrobium fastidiosum]
MRTSRQEFAVSRFNRDRKLINLDPEYQREGGVWSLAKKQLFIDSLLNGFDIPKIYVHALDRDATGYDFAVVDGKQRIGTIYEFLGGEFSLSDDFKYAGPAECTSPPLQGEKYGDFSDDAKDIIKECGLDVVVVTTKDLDDIEELFSRLNNGEKLNAAEARNAFGGSMAALVRETSKHEFFAKKLKFTNTRYAHYEVACKLLYLEKEAAKSPKTLVVVDLKKKFLDDFVRQYADIGEADAKKLQAQLSENLKAIAPIFVDADIELAKQSYPQLMYLFTNWILRLYGAPDIKGLIKTFLRDFRVERNLNLAKDEDHRDAELSEFGRLMQQGTNDSSSMQKRIEILTKRFLKANQNVLLKDPKRGFTTEERWALWQRSGKRCENCGADLPTLDDLDGDHIVLHMVGGPTSLENARALCVPCNRGAGNASHSQQPLPV